ncbi:MAG: amidohydrolase family protein [Anaerolineae bacterium]
MIIDVHTHLAGDGTSPWGQVERNLAYMDGAGVDQAVLLPQPPVNLGPDVFQRCCPTNEAALAAQARYPDRFIAFGVFDARQEGISYREEMRKLVEAGCRGFGEHKPYPPNSPRVDDPRCLEIYGLCGEADMPILFHLDHEINLDIDGFERAAAACPDTRFIAHGPNWWREMAADVPERAYPTGPVESPGRVDRMLTQYPNLYADISAGSGLRALSRDPEYARGFIARHADRLLFGTDFPCLNGATKQHFGVDRSHLTFLRGLGLPTSTLEAILSGNLLRILRRP